MIGPENARLPLNQQVQRINCDLVIYCFSCSVSSSFCTEFLFAHLDIFLSCDLFVARLNQVKERIRQEQEEERQRLEAEMQRLVALEEDHRRKVHIKEQEMGRIKEDLEKKWDQERRQVNCENYYEE